MQEENKNTTDPQFHKTAVNHSVLTLEYLAPYLPYELKGIRTFNENKNIKNIIELDSYNIMIFIDGGFSPILRPLSDLTMNIEEGKKPLAEWLCLCKNSKGNWSFDLNEISTWEITGVIDEIKLLFKHHFDVFGLIEKGLAISIHDVE